MEWFLLNYSWYGGYSPWSCTLSFHGSHVVAQCRLYFFLFIYLLFSDYLIKCTESGVQSTNCRFQIFALISLFVLSILHSIPLKPTSASATRLTLGQVRISSVSPGPIQHPTSTGHAVHCYPLLSTWLDRPSRADPGLPQTRILRPIPFILFLSLGNLSNLSIHRT
jgi:hypothetical protein